MATKSRILFMLECIEAHIDALKFFIHGETLQAAVTSIELEAGELCEALHEMEEKLVERLATDVDLQSWHDKLSRYAVSIGTVEMSDTLRELFQQAADILSRVDEKVSYPTEDFLKSIYAMFLKHYDKKPKRDILGQYNKWKAKHTRRLLAGKLKEKMAEEKQKLMSNIGEDSYYEVFDLDNDEIDSDGVVKYILNSGQNQEIVSHEGLNFSSKGCYHVFRFIVVFEQLKADLANEEQQKKQRIKKKQPIAAETYKYPRSMSQLPAALQGKIIIMEDERFAKLADLLNQKVVMYIRQQDNKQLWDVVKTLMQQNGLLPKRFAREKFAQLIAFICPDAGDAKKLQYCMEKNSMTQHEFEIASRPFSDMLKPVF